MFYFLSLPLKHLCYWVWRKPPLFNRKHSHSQQPSLAISLSPPGLWMALSGLGSGDVPSTTDQVPEFKCIEERKKELGRVILPEVDKGIKFNFYTESQKRRQCELRQQKAKLGTHSVLTWTKLFWANHSSSTLAPAGQCLFSQGIASISTTFALTEQL